MGTLARAMSMIYQITHQTTLSYSQPALLSHNVCHLAPRPCPRQEALAQRLEIYPHPQGLVERHDYFGNVVTHFNIEESHDELYLVSRLAVKVAAASTPAPTATPPWERVRDLIAGRATAELLGELQYRFDSYYIATGPALRDYALPSFPAGRPILEAVLDLVHRIHREFKYDPRSTDIATPLSQVMKQKRGVCQDFAHLAIACLRSLGLAARYVSGYLRTLPPPGRPRLEGADNSHAWFSVFVPDQGWIDLDPTNDIVVGTDHVTLAWGRDYDDVSPLRGVVLGGGDQLITVAVDVVPQV